MQFDFVYADLQVQVTFDADGASPFGQLTDKEIKLLQQLVYMTLNAFYFTRMLNAADVVEILERIKNAGKKDTDSQDEG